MEFILLIDDNMAGCADSKVCARDDCKDTPRWTINLDLVDDDHWHVCDEHLKVWFKDFPGFMFKERAIQSN